MGEEIMSTDLSCPPCKGSGDELEDSMSALGLPGGMVAIGPCSDCAGSGIAAWAVEAAADVLAGDFSNRAVWMGKAVEVLSAVREEAKKQ